MLLQIKELTKEYKRGKTPFTAVKDVNLTMEDGEFISIIGRSGSGKSTLLNLIAGLLRPTCGEITVAGQNIGCLGDEEASYFRNATIGFIPQGNSLLANFTALDNVRLPIYLFNGNSEEPGRALGLLERVGIAHLSQSHPQELSGGELRRVAIARALVNQPRFLIADEPTSDLDTETTGDIMALFRSIAGEGTGVLLVTHEPDTLDYAQKVYQMETGILSQWQGKKTPAEKSIV